MRIIILNYLFFASHGDTLLDSAIQMLVLCIYVNSYFLIIVCHDGYCSSCILDIYITLVDDTNFTAAYHDMTLQCRTIAY